MATSWNISDFKITANFDFSSLAIPLVPVSFPLDIVQFSSDWELNSIPKCVLIVPLGRRLDDTTKIASIHQVINQMKLRIPISVYMTARLTAYSDIASADVWPVNPDGSPTTFKIFEGFAIGTGFMKTMGGANFVIYLTHWLEQLNFASAISRAFQPLNPQQYSFLPIVKSLVDSGGKHFVGTTVSQDFFSETTVTEDFWGYVEEIPPPQPPLVGVGAAVAGAVGPEPILVHGGLKRWFIELASQDIINATELEALAAAFHEHIDGKNDEALAALNRIEPIKGINPGGPFGNDYLDGVPLALDPNGAATAKIANQIAEFISTQQFTDISTFTMWDKLVGDLGPLMLFSVVPQIDKALVVPFVPGLRDEFKVIESTEYDHIELNADMPRMIKAVALVGGSAVTSGAEQSEAAGPYASVGGWFQGRASGQILLRGMPPWLSNAALEWRNTGEDIGIAGIRSNAMRPAAGLIAGGGFSDFYTGIKALWDKYAQTLYLFEILRGRHGQISGKLRFDIAPGSNIRLEGSDDIFVHQQLGLAEPQHYYASVLRVSIYANSEQQQASTAFHLSYIRDEAENTDDATSIDRSPIWQNPWLGAPLSQEF